MPLGRRLVLHSWVHLIRPVLLLTFFLGIVPLSTLAQPSTPAEFIAAYRTAMQEKSVEKLTAISYTVGQSESDKKQEAHDEQMEFSNSPREIGEVSLQTLPADFQLVEIGMGKKYEPTYAPTGLIELQYKGIPNGITGEIAPYAIIGGHYFLVATKSTDLRWKGPMDKTLNWVVMGRGQDKVQITAKWNASGVEQERICNIPSVGFKGQYFEKVTVTSTADDTDVTLRIYEDGKEKFRSHALKGKGTIEYNAGNKNTPLRKF